MPQTNAPKSVDYRTEPVAEGDGIDVTVVVPGGIITGTLVPQWQYARSFTPPEQRTGPFEKLAEESLDYASRIHDVLRRHRRGEDPTEDALALADEESPSAHFLALGWAQLMLGYPNRTKSWIRVRRDDISAWHLGDLPQGALDGVDL